MTKKVLFEDNNKDMALFYRHLILGKSTYFDEVTISVF